MAASSDLTAYEYQSRLDGCLQKLQQFCTVATTESLQWYQSAVMPRAGIVALCCNVADILLEAPSNKKSLLDVVLLKGESSA